ncbi:hypothetical protein AAVH_19320 [Aphelenchoides avenae]|nr:hypothetical protein AAVH_19320 [Aphelenchus avenae]
MFMLSLRGGILTAADSAEDAGDLSSNICWREQRCRAELPDTVPKGARIGRIPVTLADGYAYYSVGYLPFGIKDGYFTVLGEMRRELAYRNRLSIVSRANNSTRRIGRYDDTPCEQLRVDLTIIHMHTVACPRDSITLLHGTDTGGKLWSFEVQDRDLVVPELRVFLEGPDARFFRLSEGRNASRNASTALDAWNGRERAHVDYDILVNHRGLRILRKEFYNLTIIAEEVAGNHTDVCRIQLWDPQFITRSLLELMKIAIKFTMTPSMDVRPRFTHCPSALRRSLAHIGANEELVMIAAEAYLSKPDVRLVDRRLKLFAHDETECRLDWHCTNYVLVNGRRPLNVAALGKLEIQLNLSAIFGGTSANDCRIVLTAKSGTDTLSESNATKAVAQSTPTGASETVVQTRALTTELICAFILAVSCFAAFAAGCLCGLRRRGRCVVRLPTVTWTRDGENFELEATRDDVSTRTGHTTLSCGAGA